jgi:hypothetical protein
MIMGEDGTQTQVQLQPDAPVAHQTMLDPNAPPPQPAMNGQTDPDAARTAALQTVFNPKIGRYAVVADVGPAYATKRQEAFNAFSQMLAQNASALPIVGDFWARNADFPGSDELAARLKQGLPPQYKADTPDPMVAKLNQALQQTTQNAQQTLQKADAQIAMLQGEVTRLQERLKEKGDEIAIKQQQVVIDDYRAESDRLKAVGAIDPVALQMVVRQMVADMVGTNLLHPQLLGHAQDQAQIQQTLQPPPQPDDGSQPDAESAPADGAAQPSDAGAQP